MVGVEHESGPCTYFENGVDVRLEAGGWVLEDLRLIGTFSSRSGFEQAGRQ